MCPDPSIERTAGGKPGVQSLSQKLLLMLYWLAFACLSVFAAQDPGYYGPRRAALPPFPWLRLVLIWVLLGLGVFVLYLIFRRPKPFYRKFLVALAIYGTLSAGAALTFVTDMPGLYYLPGEFVMVTFLGLVLAGIARAATFAARRLRNAP